MPRKREGEPQVRVHLWLYESDWNEIKSVFGNTVGASKFVRTSVRQVLKKVRERMNIKHTPFTGKNIEIELGEEESGNPQP